MMRGGVLSCLTTSFRRRLASVSCSLSQRGRIGQEGLQTRHQALRETIVIPFAPLAASERRLTPFQRPSNASSGTGVTRSVLSVLRASRSWSGSGVLRPVTNRHPERKLQPIFLEAMQDNAFPCESAGSQLLHHVSRTCPKGHLAQKRLVDREVAVIDKESTFTRRN
jgi:hypothetical protein